VWCNTTRPREREVQGPCQLIGRTSVVSLTPRVELRPDSIVASSEPPQTARQLEQTLGGRHVAVCRPVGAEEQLLDAVGVQEVVESQVPEHDED
jgi:hypothetical protein